jgi:hypothetical protein
MDAINEMLFANSFNKNTQEKDKNLQKIKENLHKP